MDSIAKTVEKAVPKKDVRSGLTTRQLIICSLFVALIAVGAFIRVPVPMVPFTLQLLFTTLAGLLLGSRLGSISVGLYVLLGLIGLPVFTEGGGPQYVLSPTFGYLLGFILGAYVCGRMTENRPTLTFSRLLGACLVNLGIVYLLGMVYLYGIMHLVIGKMVSVWYVIYYCFLLAVPGDIFLCCVAAMLGLRLIPAIRSMVRK